MPSFDSIVVGEDWISEHYFTTDSTKESFQSEVLKLRKQWDEATKEGHDSVLKGFLGARGRLQVDLAELLEEPDKAPAVYRRVREALGYKGTTAALATERTGTELVVPNVWTSQNGGVFFLEAAPVESVEDLLDSAKAAMLSRTLMDGKETDLAAPKLVSELYRTDTPPQFIVVMGGRWLLLTERERWAEGRYLAADLLLASERNDGKRGGEIDRVLAIFGRESLLPDASESIWWNQVLDSSVKHTVGVSKDLREGIRASIEIIANDVLQRRAVQGLPLNEVDGQVLARQALRYLYRILFLLYAEASPEMGVLPTGAGEYTEGYGLDRLRELTLNTLNSAQARSGTHIYQSLNKLFELVDKGHHPKPSAGHAEDLSSANAPGLHFNSLTADLFDPKKMHDVDLVRLSNSELQKVLQYLLLSKESKGKDRGFISYAELGVNQLGAVYEGLMSYTGFIAETDLHEVAKDGDATKGSWVVPVERAEGISRKDFVMALDELTGEQVPVLHEKGTFVFRLAGRERQQSASYYTPEVLTRFVVSQALEELLDQNDLPTPADDILKLTVCEPALGSGAFAIEAVRQLADEYLKRKQQELDELIPAEDYAVELQKVKAQIALHQVYGVDLNSTAVELAEVSLWLDTMVSGLQAPWFGLHLRRGNSLIGARRATYSRAAVSDTSWLTTLPSDAPLQGLSKAMNDETEDPNTIGRIHHFLLPATGWGAAADAKEVKTLAGEAQKKLNVWHTKIKSRPSKPQIERLVNLGRRVETLWQFVLRRLEVAESQVQRNIDYFGIQPPVGEPAETKAISRAKIEARLADPNGAYQRLRLIMDAWNALWFWPLTENATNGATPPSMDEWLEGLEGILGIPTSEKSSRKYGFNPRQGNIFKTSTWGELNTAEENELILAGALTIDQIIASAPWLQVCQQVAAEQGFFHWELDFASVFSRGGFDLQVGNPPWVRPRFDETSILAEFDPTWQLLENIPEGTRAEKRKATLEKSHAREFFLQSETSRHGTNQYLSNPVLYPEMEGLQTDLYRCFMSKTWKLGKSTGIVALIHKDSHFTDAKANTLRKESYLRLRRHFHFQNQLGLFEIGSTRIYSVNIYGRKNVKSSFMNMSWLFHPETATRSLIHDGSGEVPGIKTEDSQWSTAPHKERVLQVESKTINSWGKLNDLEGTPLLHSRMTYSVTNRIESALGKISDSRRARNLGLEFSRGWDESIDKKKGVIENTAKRNLTIENLILQGPHITVGNPYFKEPNATIKNKNDWTLLDIEELDESFIARSAYQRIIDRKDFDRLYGTWGEKRSLPSAFPRVAWREMADPGTVRTLHAALLPPGPTHLLTIASFGSPTLPTREIVKLAGSFMSLISDFFVKSSGATHLKRLFRIQGVVLV